MSDEAGVEYHAITRDDVHIFDMRTTPIGYGDLTYAATHLYGERLYFDQPVPGLFTFDHPRVGPSYYRFTVTESGGGYASLLHAIPVGGKRPRRESGEESQ